MPYSNKTPAFLLEDMPSPIFLLEADKPTIRWVNQAGLEWLEKSRRSIIGRDISDFFDNIDSVISAHKRCSEHRTQMSLRDFLITRRGKPDQLCRLSIFPSEAGIGFLIQFSGSQSGYPSADGQAMSAMGHMLAHEIKNPLAGINGAAQLLRDDIRTEEGLALIDLIGSEIERIRRLADRMQSLGNIDPKNEGAVNIHEVLRQARRIVQSSDTKNLIFTEAYDPSLPLIIGDPDSLMQAVLNLIKNAYEAITINGHSDAQEKPKAGEIILETTFRSGVKRRITGAGGRERSLPIEIRIIDNGPGIPDAIRDQIFQPFITQKTGGQGLGLALVSKVISAHDGIVEVRSRPGRTVFSLLLPTPDEADNAI